MNPARKRLVRQLSSVILIAALATVAGMAFARMDYRTPQPAPQAQPFGYVAPVALSSPNVSSGAAVLYQPWFDMGDYSGDLFAFPLNNQGQLPASSSWQAGEMLDAAAAVNPRFWDTGRVIITGNEDGRGIPFRFQRLSAAQQSLARSEDVVNYVRGKRDFASSDPGCCCEKDDDEDDDRDNESNHNGDSSSSTMGATKIATTVSPLVKVGSARVLSMTASEEPKQPMSSPEHEDGTKPLEDDSEDDDDGERPAKPCESGPSFFDRSLLGALIHTRPVFIGAPREGYPFDGYTSEFARTLADRTPIVYAGANDGLLHAFNAQTGEEIFAYVPSMVLGNLPAYAGAGSSPAPARDNDEDDDEPQQMSEKADVRLMSAEFKVASEGDDDEDDDGHKRKTPSPTTPAPTLVYTVDGPLTGADVRINGQWRTALAGSLGAGGRGYFALDVTDPAQIADTENNASRMLLWEFTPADDPDVGYSYSRVSIVRLNDRDRTWAAVFGNGYFAESGRAVFYIVDIATGRLIKKLVAGTGVGGANGLSSPTLVDINGDYSVDHAYAGDLQGNLWKFDLSGESPDQWRVAFEGQPFYTPRAARGETQSITTAPAVSFHPFRGLLITVATGRLLGSSDLGAGGGDSVYGLWDEGSPVARDATLTATTLTETPETQRRTAALGFVDWSASRGWRLDLPAGERVLTDPIVRADRIQFTSTNPVSGANWLLELDASTGAAPRVAIFGFDQTGSDPNAGRVVGLSQGTGLVSRPTLAMLAAGVDSFYINRIQAISQSCVAKRPPRKKHENDDDEDDDGDDDGKGDDHREMSRAFSDDGEGNDDEDDDGDKDVTDDECVTPPPPPRCGENRDGDDGKGAGNGEGGGDDDGEGRHRIPTAPQPPTQVSTQGGVNFGAQEGKNVPGRKLWREAVPVAAPASATTPP